MSSKSRSEYEEKLLADLKTLLGGKLTYSDEPLTRVSPNRDALGYITSIEYYAGTTLKFTLTITRNPTTHKIEPPGIVRS